MFNATFPINVFKSILSPYYQNDISCFLENIDPIFKISGQTTNGASVSFGPAFSESSGMLDFQQFEISKNNTFRTWIGTRPGLF